MINQQFSVIDRSEYIKNRLLKIGVLPVVCQDVDFYEVNKFLFDLLVKYQDHFSPKPGLQIINNKYIWARDTDSDQQMTLEDDLRLLESIANL